MRKTRVGLGLFANKPFSKGELVIEYTGAQCYPGEAVMLCPDGTQDLSGTRYGDGPYGP